MEIGAQVIIKRIIFDKEKREDLIGLIGVLYSRSNTGWFNIGYLEWTPQGTIPFNVEAHQSEFEEWVDPRKSKLAKAAELIFEPEHLKVKCVAGQVESWESWVGTTLMEHRRVNAVGIFVTDIRFGSLVATILKHPEGYAAYSPDELEKMPDTLTTWMWL